MKTKEQLSDATLQTWIDGEAGDDAARIEAYVNAHPEAMQRVEDLSRAREWLTHLVDDGLGPVDPLAGMAAIRERIRDREQSRLSNRLRVWWDDIWRFNRGAVLGVALAGFAGVVAAPAVLWLMAEEARDYENGEMANGETFIDEDDLYAPAGISIESLEVGGNRSARVLDSGETTLIWVGGEDSDDWDGYGDDVDGSEEH